MKFKFARTRSFFLSLRVLVISQRASRVNFFKTTQRIAIEIPEHVFRRKQHSTITTECVLYSISFIDIIVCSSVWRTEISMKYSDAANTFWVGGMNFNCVYKEVSKDNLVHSSVRNRRVMWRWTSIFVDVLPFADKYTLSLSLFMSLLAFRFVSLPLSFSAVL